MTANPLEAWQSVMLIRTANKSGAVKQPLYSRQISRQQFLQGDETPTRGCDHADSGPITASVAPHDDRTLIALERDGRGFHSSQRVRKLPFEARQWFQD
jgi:hypothetical protein